MEWFLVPGFVLCLIVVPLYFRFRRSSKKTISYSVRQELDQTPEWWDNEFRKLQGLPSLEYERMAQAGISEVWDGDLHFSFKHLIDPKPPTVAEIWSPGPNDSYDLSVDLSAMSSSIQKAMEGKSD